MSEQLAEHQSEPPRVESGEQGFLVNERHNYDDYRAAEVVNLLRRNLNSGVFGIEGDLAETDAFKGVLNDLLERANSELTTAFYQYNQGLCDEKVIISALANVGSYLHGAQTPLAHVDAAPGDLRQRLHNLIDSIDQSSQSAVERPEELVDDLKEAIDKIPESTAAIGDIVSEIVDIKTDLHRVGSLLNTGLTDRHEVWGELNSIIDRLSDIANAVSATTDRPLMEPALLDDIKRQIVQFGRS